MNKPQPSEYHPFFNGYIQNVPGGNFVQLLEDNSNAVQSFFISIDKDKADYSYEPGKWTIRQMILHMSDTERVMSYRALTIARGDFNATLSSMDQNLFAAHANAGNRTVEDLLDEFVVIRKATVFLFSNISEAQSVYKSKVLEHFITARALGYIIIGHAIHHMNVVRQKYL